MLKEDRFELNTRFIDVFKELEERGEIKKNDREGKGMGDFALRILGNRGYGHIIRAFLDPNNKRCIDFYQARKLCDQYNVNPNFMFDGSGSPFGQDLEIASKEAPMIEGEGNILFTTAKAFAGSSVAISQDEQNKRFSIPGYEGSGLVAFPIQGDSMEPVINNGDTVICRQLETFSEIKENEIYAVRNSGNLWVKYVQRINGKNGHLEKLKLISANYLEYDPFEEAISEYTRIYKVISRINPL